MSELERELFENQLRSIAKRLDYPRTPNIAGRVRVMTQPAVRFSLFERSQIKTVRR